MVPADSQQISRARCYSGTNTTPPWSSSRTGLSPSTAGVSTPLPLTTTTDATGRQTGHALAPQPPTCNPCRVSHTWVLAIIHVRSPLLTESQLFSSPTGTEMFHFPVFTPTPAIYSPAGDHTSLRPGFPIRTSSDQRSVGNSPRHNAASHVLHRLDMPRHPPCALKNKQHHTTPPTNPPQGRTGKRHDARSDTQNLQKNKDARVHYTVLTQHNTNTTTPTPQQGNKRNRHRCPQETTQHTCHPRHPTACHLPTFLFRHHTDDHLHPINNTPMATTSGFQHRHRTHTTNRWHHGHSTKIKLLRKEVIQPHLPVRLPCYDFVPIADPTFDSSPHKGWATGFGCYQLS